MKESPFGNKRRGTYVVAEGEKQSVEATEVVQQPGVTAGRREKLQVKKKAIGALKGQATTATSGAFMTTEGAGKVDASATAAAVTKDATASTELEVEKAHDQPEGGKQGTATELARKKTFEKAAQRLAEHIAKAAQDAASVDAVASGDAIASEEAAEAGREITEKIEEVIKKKTAQASQGPKRASARLRSGALKK